MKENSRFIWVNGKIVPDHTSVFSAESRGMMYGAGCFETMRMSRGHLFRPDQHLERLNRGLEYLGAGYRLREKDLNEAVSGLVEKNSSESDLFLIRVQASLAGPRGYSRLDDPVHVVISADPEGARKNSCRLTAVETTVVPSSSRPPGIKLSNALHFMQAWRQAREKGFDDAYMLTVGGRVAETAIANLFWKKGNLIQTPSEDCDILPGIMRKTVLELLDRRSDCVVETGTYSPEDLIGADLVWVTNSLNLIQPVTNVDEHFYPPGDAFLESLKRELASCMKMQITS